MEDSQIEGNHWDDESSEDTPSRDSQGESFTESQDIKDDLTDPPIRPAVGIVLMVASTVIMSILLGTMLVDIQQEPTPIVSFDQETVDETTQVTIQVVEKGGAEEIIVATESPVATLNEIGDTTTIRGLESGQKITVYFEDRYGDRVVIQTYTVK